MFGLESLEPIAKIAMTRLNQILDTLEEIREQTSQRQPDAFTISGSGTLAPGATTNVTVGDIGGTRIPEGKRLLLQRVATTAPAATGPCAVYSTTSGSVDGGNLREVIDVPTLYADAINGGGTMIPGGSTLMAVFNQVPATGGVCTIRYEGLLFDDVAPGDLG